MSNPPSGTVTFLFTDIEGSTKRWEERRVDMSSALQTHDAILRSTIEQHGGYVFKTVGDAFCAAFPIPHGALSAAINIQHTLLTEQWPADIGQVRVRIALHTGVTEERDADYFGQPVNRVARLLSAGHGGQVLLSDPTHDLVRDSLPAGVTLTDLGEHRLKDLIRSEHIFQLQAEDLPSVFPPLKTLDNRPNNLPLQPTPFIGREKELAEVEALLRNPEVHLVTLTGSGGTGKTRLSLQVGADLLDDFFDGVWFVELAALVEPKLVIPTIAATLGVKEAGGTPLMETLKEHLRDKKLLLMLDNFEQVIEAAPHVSQLLSSGMGVKVLVTSRVPLRLRGEREYAVPPLSLPDLRYLPTLEKLTQYEAVRLFIERATSVNAGFQVTNENAPSVAEICVRLDGLPLAIELAAARVKMLSPQALLSRLSQRLKVLTGGARDLTARQQTLRGAIGWSYDLLDEGEKQLFSRMAVFQGGRSFESLETVCNHDGQLQRDVFEGVQSLLDKSLIQQREGSDREPRFWMLETIHEYAREKLQGSNEAQALQREHALYFMRLAEEAEPHLTGKEQQEWLDRLEDEYDNLRAALAWAGEHAHRGDNEAVEIGLRIGGALWRYWYMRGLYTDGRAQLERTLALPDEVLQACSPASRTKALNGAGILAWLQADYSSARSQLEAALVLGRGVGDKRGMSRALGNLGNVAIEQGDYTAARALFDESLALSRELGDKRDIAVRLITIGSIAYLQGDYTGARAVYEECVVLFREVGDKSSFALSLDNLGLVAQEQGDYAGAITLHEESLALRRELGEKGGIALSLNNLGTLAWQRGDYTGAGALLEESLALRRELGDRKGIANSLGNLGGMACEQGDYTGAGALYEESLALRRELGDKQGIAVSLAGLGVVAVGMGEVERGAKLLGVVEGLLESLGAVLNREDRLPYERAVASARSLLGEEAFERAWQEGRGMSMEEAIDYALERTISSGSRS
jgi:predicted ATPase/class 3 adenylate cyclase